MPLTDLDASAGETLRCLAGPMRMDSAVSELEAVELKTWGANDKSLLEALLAGHESVPTPRSDAQVDSPEGVRSNAAGWVGRQSVESKMSQHSLRSSRHEVSPAQETPSWEDHPGLGRQSLESRRSQQSPASSSQGVSPAQQSFGDVDHPGWAGRQSLESYASQQSPAVSRQGASTVQGTPSSEQHAGHPQWSPGLLRREAPGGVEVALQSPPGRSAWNTPESAHRAIDVPAVATAVAKVGQARLEEDSKPSDSLERASHIPVPRPRPSSMSRAGVPPPAPSYSSPCETPTQIGRPRRQPSADRLRPPPRPASTDARRPTGQSSQKPPSSASRASSSGPRRRSSGALPPSFSPAPRADGHSYVEASRAAGSGGPAVRSNRKLIRNALEKCCLKGDVNKELRDNVLQAFDTDLAAFERFVIVFRSVHTGRHDFRALYRFQDSHWVLSWNALPSPRVLEENMVAQRLQYNSAVKDFREVLATQEIQHVADAIFMKPEFLPKVKVGP